LIITFYKVLFVIIFLSNSCADDTLLLTTNACIGWFWLPILWAIWFAPVPCTKLKLGVGGGAGADAPPLGAPFSIGLVDSIFLMFANPATTANPAITGPKTIPAGPPTEEGIIAEVKEATADAPAEQKPAEMTVAETDATAKAIENAIKSIMIKYADDNDKKLEAIEAKFTIQL